jgi:translation elongation factor EF-1alpha
MPTLSFKAHIVVLDRQGRISNNDCPLVDCGMASGRCKVKLIQQKIDRHTLKPVERSPQFVEVGDAAIVVMEPLEDMCVEKFSVYPAPSRFVVRESGVILAVGIVTDVINRDDALLQMGKSSAI